MGTERHHMEVFVVEHVSCCDLCRSTQQRAFEEYHRYGQTFALVDCVDCGLGFLNPRPRQSEMGRYYDDGYNVRHRVFRERPTGALVSRLLRRALRARYEGSTLESALVRLLLFPWQMKCHDILRRNHLEGMTRIGRVLDVGCGRGAWLASMRRWGFDCYGCEPDPKAAEMARGAGLPVDCSDLPDAAYPADRFDVVRCMGVLEHVPNPTTVLREMRRILKPGGLVIIDVPNHMGLTAQALRHTEDVPRHLHSYSPEALRRYFDKAGLRTVRVATEIPRPHTIYGYFGSYAVEVLKSSSTAEQVARAEQFWSHENRKRRAEFRATAQSFDSVGCGCHIIGAATKG